MGKTAGKVNLDDRNNPDIEGYLVKEGGSVKSKKKRWFLLKGKKVFYFKYKGDLFCKGFFELDEKSEVKLVHAKEFHIITSKRTYPCVSDTKEEATLWVEAVQKNLNILKGLPAVQIVQSISQLNLSGIQQPNPNIPPAQLQKQSSQSNITTPTPIVPIQPIQPIQPITQPVVVQPTPVVAQPTPIVANTAQSSPPKSATPPPQTRPTSATIGGGPIPTNINLNQAPAQGTRPSSGTISGPPQFIPPRPTTGPMAPQNIAARPVAVGQPQTTGGPPRKLPAVNQGSQLNLKPAAVSAPATQPTENGSGAPPPQYPPPQPGASKPLPQPNPQQLPGQPLKGQGPIAKPAAAPLVQTAPAQTSPIQSAPVQAAPPAQPTGQQQQQPPFNPNDPNQQQGFYYPPQQFMGYPPQGYYYPYGYPGYPPMQPGQQPPAPNADPNNPQAQQAPGQPPFTGYPPMQPGQQPFPYPPQQAPGQPQQPGTAGQPQPYPYPPMQPGQPYPYQYPPMQPGQPPYPYPAPGQQPTPYQYPYPQQPAASAAPTNAPQPIK
ncbi:hypothetical protein PPL_05533 [Heterostelium album PN500]|uniref:PH domain-containing protein n=1 Tax=Heterostelium pallidum (strain ATCC 26659 / Pp 5 / PN500) TaxID=670386 RepID=D3BAF7_HETP5|nr:hypothetical protein PPL_05533 [Heterostelium album PN500]EFA81544.1 hypothetical protein PPL_05533 [Heterostelium album PN500]|eukprot:XP_020433661.1 hypothetical protein PPL_05533 [Heterostelium album PN500]